MADHNRLPLSFSLNYKDNWLTKKKRKVPITMCTRSAMDGAGARVTWEIQFRRIRVLITLSWVVKRNRSPPDHSVTQGMVKEHRLESVACSFCCSLAVYIRQGFSPCWVIAFSSLKCECSSTASHSPWPPPQVLVVSSYLGWPQQGLSVLRDSESSSLTSCPEAHLFPLMCEMPQDPLGALAYSRQGS